MAGLYYFSAYRIRGWGKLPRERRGLLLIANHQHDLDTNAAVIYILAQGPWRQTIYSASSRRVFEPGFMGIRVPWLERALGAFDASGLMYALGMLPIENELFARAVSSIAWFFKTRHGDLPLADVFRPDVVATFGPEAVHKKLSWLFGRSAFTLARKTRVGMNAVNEPYRTQILRETRASVPADLQRIEDTLRRGVTFYLTPEGRYSTDGSVGRFRQALRRLQPLAPVHMIAMSYDVFVGRRLSVLFRLLPPPDPSDLRTSLQSARPVTTSQLIAAWLVHTDVGFDRDTALHEVIQRLRAVQALRAFVDPELARDPARMVGAALRWMERRKIIRFDDGVYQLCPRRVHPQFPQVKDILSFQATFFAETEAALRRLAPRADA